MITFLCPGCRREFRVKLELSGKAIRCTRCLHAVRVPVFDPTDEMPCLDELLTGSMNAASIASEAPTPRLIPHPASR